MISNSLPADAALRTRAARVIPGGMYGHLNVARLPAGYPQFFARAEGATLWDVDGNSYVDFMCAYGPMVLGYGNREVEAAAAAQRELGDVLTGPSERLVELAEKLVADMTKERGLENVGTLANEPTELAGLPAFRLTFDPSPSSKT